MTESVIIDWFWWLFRTTLQQWLLGAQNQHGIKDRIIVLTL